PRPARGREGLRKYDPDAYDLLDHIYSGKLAVKRVKMITLVSEAPAREKTLRSLRAEAKTSVLFVNRTPEILQVYWLDYPGKRKLYSVVQPGGTYEVTTFATHPWVVTNEKREVKGLFVSRAEAGKAVIGPKPVPTPKSHLGQLYRYARSNATTMQ